MLAAVNLQHTLFRRSMGADAKDASAPARRARINWAEIAAAKEAGVRVLAVEQRGLITRFVLDGEESGSGLNSKQRRQLARKGKPRAQQPAEQVGAPAADKVADQTKQAAPPRGGNSSPAKALAQTKYPGVLPGEEKEEASKAPPQAPPASQPSASPALPKTWASAAQPPTSSVLQLTPKKEPRAEPPAASTPPPKSIAPAPSAAAEVVDVAMKAGNKREKGPSMPTGQEAVNTWKLTPEKKQGKPTSKALQESPKKPDPRHVFAAYKVMKETWEDYDEEGTCAAQVPMAPCRPFYQIGVSTLYLIRANALDDVTGEEPGYWGDVGMHFTSGSRVVKRPAALEMREVYTAWEALRYASKHDRQFERIGCSEVFMITHRGLRSWRDEERSVDWHEQAWDGFDGYIYGFDGYGSTC